MPLDNLNIQFTKVILKWAQERRMELDPQLFKRNDSGIGKHGSTVAINETRVGNPYVDHLLVPQEHLSSSSGTPSLHSGIFKPPYLI